MKKNYQNDKIHLIFIRNFIYECEKKKKKCCTSNGRATMGVGSRGGHLPLSFAKIPYNNNNNNNNNNKDLLMCALRAYISKPF